MRPLGVAAIALATLLGGACATMNVSSHVERGLDFSQYRTFDWGAPDELPTGDPRLDRDPFFKDHMQGAVERQFARHGIALSPTPDVRVHYHASIATRMNVATVDRNRGYCPSGSCGPSVSEYEAGTLILDVVDTRTNRVIWRGWAQDAVGDVFEHQDVMARKIDEAVSRILAQWPGGPVSGRR